MARRCRCGNVIDDHRGPEGVWCSRACKRKHHPSPASRRNSDRFRIALAAVRGDERALRKVHLSRRREGKLWRLYSNLKRYRKTRFERPWAKFERAVVRLVRVAGTAEAQEIAERAITKGACGYRNKDGRIGWVGPPKRPEKAGRIYASVDVLENARG